MRARSYASNRHAAAVAERISAVLANHPDIEQGEQRTAGDSGPDDLARSGVILLALKPEFDGREAFAGSLAADGRYHVHLIDPELLSVDQSVVAAQAICQVDTGFLVGLIRAADEIGESRPVMRTLEIVDRLNKTTIAAQWVRRLTGHEDPAVGSKAVKMLSCLHVNLLFIERQLGSGDPRIRANAVEALWSVKSPGAQQLLERAAADLHHRVRANGLLGLCRINAPNAVQRMIDAASTDSPLLRAAIAWAMGQLDPQEFEAELEKLTQDPEESVRQCAARAISTRKRILQQVGES